MVQTEIPQFLAGKVIVVPVVQVERAPHVPSWRRQSCSAVDRFVRHEARSKVLVGPCAQAQGLGLRPPLGRGTGGGVTGSLTPR